MATVLIPPHTHVNPNGSTCNVDVLVLPKVVEGCPITADALLGNFQHIPMILIPIVGLIYAGILCKRYVKAKKTIYLKDNFLPNSYCPRCRETALVMKLPIIISFLGGIGLLLPLLVLLTPILLIFGIIKTILAIGKCVKAQIAHKQNPRI
ncbi:hypothetical protein [Chlamydia vaughanii]|uniref:hypothetical protein n=1 Tax=Chlamydia vaughanii TaxID=3112552 RepID=UPI0032B120D1